MSSFYFFQISYCVHVLFFVYLVSCVIGFQTTFFLDFD